MDVGNQFLFELFWRDSFARDAKSESLVFFFSIEIKPRKVGGGGIKSCLKFCGYSLWEDDFFIDHTFEITIFT
jgi:hypothetical protein